MPKVTFFTEKGITESFCPAGIPLTEAAASAGVTIVAPCGGKGICGNCRVVVEGEVSKPSAAEISFLRGDERKGIRLACMTYVAGDCKAAVLSAGLKAETAKSAISSSTGLNKSKHFAAVADIGTTSVIIDVYSLPECEKAAHKVFMNPQVNYGSDVVTRLDYCINGDRKILTEIINSAIDKAFESLNVNPEFVIVTGNTAMLHIAAGKDARGLANYPFEPETLFGEWIGDRYYMRCASAYIGGDVVASVLASRITESRAAAVLSDIGTNNETVLYNGTELFACSSAAGPAFEGARISRGMPASDGAITKVKIGADGTVLCETVGNAKPRGFCGSGLISAVDELYKNGYISHAGDILAALPEFGGVAITPSDIAELQLAKSAVYSGITSLAHKAGIGLESIKKFVPAGNFGAELDLEAAERIGMIPAGFALITAAPVSAAEGAAMLLKDESRIPESVRIAQSVNTLELANYEFFADEFIGNLYFPYLDEETEIENFIKRTERRKNGL